MRSRAWSILPVAAVIGALAAGTVLANSQAVVDAPGDGRGGCEILRATAGHLGSKLKHTITMADAIADKADAPIVIVFGKPSEVGGTPKAILGPGRGLTLRISANSRTVTYTATPSKLRAEMGVPRTRTSYFWVASGCLRNPDWAPDTAAGHAQVRAHRFLR